MKKKYWWQHIDHDKTPYGLELSEKGAVYLMKGGIIANNHRDYCGMGFSFFDNKFHYGDVFDGYYTNDFNTWETKEAFVIWLSEQSDYSMSGHAEAGIENWLIDNQRITRGRLENLEPIK